MSDLLRPGQRVHVIGCAGAGMSALTRYLIDTGCIVSGCDASGHDELARLAREGATTYDSHSATHVDDVDVVTASAAVGATHVELVAARRRGVKVLARTDVLGELSLSTSIVAFAGTHGKTTTTSMAARIWRAAGRDPSWLVGTPIAGLGPNGRGGRDPELLLEADESYGAFARLEPVALGLLNVESDHLDHYGDLDTLQRAFVGLVDRTRAHVSLWGDDEGAARVASMSPRSLRGVGRGPRAAVRVLGEQFSLSGSRFTLRAPEGQVEIALRVPGALNVANAAMAASVALSCGVALEDVAAGLLDFRGAPRRFDIVERLGATTIVDDYAHLPGEVSATIEAARSMGFERVAAVFQPHRVSRTAALASSFAGAFAGVEDLVVTDIYRSGEPNPTGLTGEVVANAVAAGPGAPRVSYAANWNDAATHLAAQVGDVDCILVLGAGDVGRIVPMIVKLVRT